MLTLACALVPAIVAAQSVEKPAPAPAPSPQSYDTMWQKRIDDIHKLRSTAANDLRDNLGRQIDVRSTPTAFFLFAYARQIAPNLRAIEDERTDKQLGSPASVAGSTSLVSRGAVPAVLAFAVEHGAMSQTGDATTATVRGNAIGWLDLLQGQDFIASYEDDSRLTRALRALSYSFTFNTQGKATAAAAERPDPAQVKEQIEAAGRQLAAFSARLAFFDGRDPRRRANRAAVVKAMSGSGQNLAQAVQPFNDFFLSDNYRTWRTDTVNALTGPAKMSRGDVERVLYARLELLLGLMAQPAPAGVPNFHTEVARFVNALQAFEVARAGVFEALQQRFVLAAEYVRSRPADEPSSSTVRLVGEGRPGKTRLDVALNAAVTWQHAGTALIPEPKETEGLRDVQLGVHAELPYGKGNPCADTSSGIGRPVISLEYLSRRLFADATVNFGGHDFSVEPGWIHVAQVKVTVPVKGSGVKVPLSFSVANRTELLREKDVRAHLGLTFDLDVLTSAVRR
ncbi:hypothetical protein BH18ACI5_BH18ACI5_06710 [soil metagenome]